MIRVIPAEESHVPLLVRGLRQIDRTEIYYTTGSVDFADTILEGIHSPDSVSFSIFHDDVMLCICGMVRRDRYNIVWALGTNDINNYKLAFFRETKKLLMNHRNHNPMVNFVYQGNESSKAYLQRLGFILEDAVPYGKLKKKFHHFWMKGI